MMARLTAKLHNHWRGKGEQPVGVEDMIPNFKRPQQTPEQIKATLRRILSGNR